MVKASSYRLCRSNACNVVGIIVLEFVDVADNLVLISADSGEKEKVLQVLVVTEWRQLDDNLL